ncbi:uncharacterized protein METZ01_LOCUS302008, partial [marine metagenome]
MLDHAVEEYERPQQGRRYTTGHREQEGSDVKRAQMPARGGEEAPVLPRCVGAFSRRLVAGRLLHESATQAEPIGLGQK